MNMDVSIIIVNYNTLNLLKNCIRSIILFTYEVEYEIIIVDNNSNDNISILSEEFGPKIICLNLSDNIGFGRACNEGAKVAKGEFLFFLNPDTILLNNAVKILLEKLKSSIDIGVCGGNLYDINLLPMHSFKMFFPSIFWELNELLMGIPEKKLYSNCFGFNSTNVDKEVGYITGADLMISRDLFFQIGSFSNDFFMYFEETDLCYRVHKLKKSIYSIPSAKIQHLEGKSFGDGMINLNRIRFWEQGRFIYYKRNKLKLQRFFIHLLYGLNLILRETVHRLLKNQDARIYYKNRRRVFFYLLFNI